MTKYYCDKCGAGGKGAALDTRFRFKLGKIEGELMLCTNGVWNQGILCLECAKALVAKGKPIEPKYG